MQRNVVVTGAAGQSASLLLPALRKRYKLTLLDVQGFPLERKWYLVYPRNRELSLVAKTFLEFALEDGAELRTRLEAVRKALTRNRKH